ARVKPAHDDRINQPDLVSLPAFLHDVRLASKTHRQDRHSDRQPVPEASHALDDVNERSPMKRREIRVMNSQAFLHSDSPRTGNIRRGCAAALISRIVDAAPGGRRRCVRGIAFVAIRILVPGTLASIQASRHRASLHLYPPLMATCHHNGCS
ncbi:MAG: hypothetical protein WD005_04450, partial [Haliea sp.]